MKTIEERAYSHYASDECCRDCENCEDRVNCFDADYVWAFIAGARSEYNELTRWNSPDCPPEDRRPVLLKMTNAVNGLIRYAVASYIAGRFLCPEMLPKNEILGWREIHE